MKESGGGEVPKYTIQILILKTNSIKQLISSTFLSFLNQTILTVYSSPIASHIHTRIC
jgi:hypothetical protein